MANSEQPVRTPLSQMLGDFRYRALPLVVWSAATLIAVVLLFHRTQRLEFIGLAQAREYEVSTAATGILEAVVVDLYDDVEAGELVAKLDDRPLTASIDTIQATISQLDAELQASRSQFSNDTGQSYAQWQSDLRRFQIDEEQRRLEALALRVQIESDQFDQERLALEVKRSEKLLEIGLTSEMEVEGNRLAHAQVRERVEENQVLLAQTQEEFRAARARREGYEKNLPGPPPEEHILQPLREAISVESRRLKEIEIQRSTMFLRSPVSGRVSQILCRRGQSVIPGEPILLVSEHSVSEIVAYLGEDDTTRVTADTPVLLSSRMMPGASAESVVLRVSPGVQELPQRLWTDPRAPSFGRAVIIAGVPGMQLTPGERVGVKFLPSTD